MFNFRKKRHERELKNARQKRYYHKHLSKKAREKKLRLKTIKETKIEPKKENEIVFAGEPVKLL